MTYSFVQADLVPLIKRSIREIEPLAQAKKIELKISFDDGPLQLNMDLEKIHQVLRNLLGNAVKFTPEEGNVTISAQKIAAGAEISVIDTGPGIPPEDLERIFDKYQQARSNNANPGRGTGLGLAIVKHIVSAHGGKVWAKSDQGTGSVFTFTLAF